ncbi:regulator of chromosome condensation 1/beta-lactamase-inhibitor protein II, partial [Baffinella frigidus]
VACGGGHAIALTTARDVFTWGQPCKGCCERGGAHANLVLSVWRLAFAFSDGWAFWRQVACGGGHAIALTTARDVFTWGRNKYGQLG